MTIRPAEHLEGRELLDAMKGAIEELPSRQRQVIVLRDIEGWNAEEGLHHRGISG